MTFIVNGIKEGLDKKYNIEFVLWVDSTLLAKKFLENTWIIVLSLKEYKEDKKFGNIFLTINYQQQNIALFTKFDGDLNQACKFFLMMGFDIGDINFINNPIPNEEALKIVEISKKENEIRIQKEREDATKKDNAEKKIFEDPKLNQDKKVIEQIFTKIEKVLEMASWFISGKDLKNIREKEDELKKLKLGTNHERIVELVEETTAIVENIESEYYNATSTQEKKIFEDSIVTDIDINKELNKITKIEQLEGVWWKIKNIEKEYQIFGGNIIFLKMLYRDFFYLIKTPERMTNIFYSAYDLIELIIIFVIIQTNIYTIANSIFLFSDNFNYEYFHIVGIKTWVLWWLIFCSRWLRKRKKSILIILIPAVIIAYYILIKIINNNFSI